MSTYQAVVVGTDGSDSSFRAVDRAAQIAAGADAKLIVATAYFPHAEDQHGSNALKDESYKLQGNA
ncbi:MAG: universal stress protein, partial [Actinomycetia bacterium]|nr:universal stress protein [Actinomycetes bacterium]